MSEAEKLEQTARTNDRYRIRNVIHHAFVANYYLPSKEKRKCVTDKLKPVKLTFLQRMLERHNAAVRRLAFI